MLPPGNPAGGTGVTGAGALGGRDPGPVVTGFDLGGHEIPSLQDGTQPVAGSLAWWLLDPEIDGQTRLARSLVYRLHSAALTERAIQALGLEPEDKPSEYGELPEAVEHAELLGLQRNLVDSGQSSPGVQIRPGPATAM